MIEVAGSALVLAAAFLMAYVSERTSPVVGVVWPLFILSIAAELAILFQ